jgi:hypothetical protein
MTGELHGNNRAPQKHSTSKADAGIILEKERYSDFERYSGSLNFFSFPGYTKLTVRVAPCAATYKNPYFVHMHTHRLIHSVACRSNVACVSCYSDRHSDYIAKGVILYIRLTD